MKSKIDILYGADGDVQVVLVRSNAIITDAFYAHARQPNLVGLIAPAKITEVSKTAAGTRIFAALPNGAPGWVEGSPRVKAGDIINARVSGYVTAGKGWPLKTSDKATKPAPSLLERAVALFPVSPVREDNETIADWLHSGTLADRRCTITLADGANLIVESTSALTTIDLNTGRQKNIAVLIAAFGPAIASAMRQLQLGGAIVIDAAFLAPAARKGLADKIKKHLADDPLKPKVIGISKGGLIELTRPRMGPSLLEFV